MVDFNYLRIDRAEQEVISHYGDFDECYRLYIEYSPISKQYFLLDESGYPIMSDEALFKIAEIATGGVVDAEEFPFFVQEGKRFKKLRSKYCGEEVEASANPVSGSVYLINAVGTNRYKIGITTNIEARLSQLTKQSPFPLQIEIAFDSFDIRRDEKTLHEKFKKLRVFGEWFDLADEDALPDVLDAMRRLYEKNLAIAVEGKGEI